jgi:cation transport protein ChaC
MTSCSAAAAAAQEGVGVWVFGYGSLMWDPGFVHVAARPARLFGWHRAMCILSNHWRGTKERPGLVLGLDRGGSCAGRAFLVAAAAWPAVQAQLHEREMVSAVYRPCFLPVRLDDGRRVPAWAFVANRGHPQYWRGDPAAACALIRQGLGRKGSSRDYLAAAVAHIEDLGVAGGALRRLLRQVDSGA